MSFYIGKCFQAAFGNLNIYGILLAALFTVLWLMLYKPPILRKPLLWAFFVSGALFTLIVLCIIQNPLSMVINQSFYNSWGEEFVQQWILILALPGALITGFFQEGAMVFPVAIYWWINKRTIDPKWALIIGAVAGAGWGFIEAQWLHNSILSMGWSWQLVGTTGFVALAPFVETFFSIPYSAASCALISYGLAKGRGWQFYCVIALIHAVIQYSSTFVGYTFSGLTSSSQLIIIEVFLAICSLAFSAVALFILWKKLKGDSKETTAS